MYVPPRPSPQDDPLFALRLATMTALAFALTPIWDPQLPALFALIPIFLLAGGRKKPTFAKMVLAPLALAIAFYALALLVELTQPMPVLMLAIVFLIYISGFRIVLRTGSPMGMILLVIISLLSIAGLKSPQTLFVFRDNLIDGAILAAIAAPTLYFFFPAYTDEVHKDPKVSSFSDQGKAALIRAAVLMGMAFWLYSVLQTKDILLAVSAIYPLVYPTNQQAWREAIERVSAAFLGSLIAMALLIVIGWNAHYAIVVGALFVVALMLGSRMMIGPGTATFYKSTLVVIVAVIGSAMTSRDPASVVLGRVVLTFLGAGLAIIAVAFLDQIFSTPNKQPIVDKSTPEHA